MRILKPHEPSNIAILLPVACVFFAFSCMGQSNDNSALSLLITNQPVNQTVFLGGSAAFTVGVSNAGPLDYQWQFNGINLTGSILTVAGDGTNGFSGDGGTATHADLNGPGSVAVDGFGNLFIADTFNNRVRQVAGNGLIFTVAGGGTAGLGDGGLATNAMLSEPQGVAVDVLGNLFIADSGNGRVRQVAANSTITTVAGGGTVGQSDGGLATNAILGYPVGLAVDGLGDLYIADQGSNCIRMVDAAGIIWTVAGNTKPGFSGDGGYATNASLSAPAGVAVDDLGGLYIADQGNNSIRMVDTNGMIWTVAGNTEPGYSGDGAAATNASLNGPGGVSLDTGGNLFIADTSNSVVRQVGLNGIIWTAAGNGAQGYAGDGGAATNAALDDPAGVFVDDYGNVFIADKDNSRIREIPDLGPALLLNHVTAGMAGSYDVVVTSPYDGSVTSSVAILTVSTLAIDDLNNGSYAISGIGSPGYVCSLQFTEDLNLTNWQTLYQTIADTNGFFMFTDVSASQQRFYRVSAFAGAPSITTQPVNQTVSAGSNAAFVVSATSWAPNNYQWYFNGAVISGQTNATLSLAAAYLTNAGSYDVVVANPYGSVTSSVATLTVTLITSNPANQVVFYRSNATFTVGVSGAGPFTYQWYFDGDAISGQTNATLSLPAAYLTNAGSYDVVVTDPYGSVTSSVVTLTVNTLAINNLNNGSYAISGVGAPGYLCSLQFTGDLSQSNWQTLAETNADPTGAYLFIDVSGSPQRFYRVAISKEPLLPSVTTLAASAITATNATLNGSVTPNGAVSTVYFQWGATTSYGQFTSSNVLSGNLNTAQAVALDMTGLLPGTTNHFEAVAVNSAGTSYGADLIVVSPALAPSVTTLAASAITETAATLNGSVTPNGAVSTVYFQWGATTNYGQFTSSNVLSGNLDSAQAVALDITGLLPGTTNHFEAVAVNSAGTTYGADLIVVTPPLAPSVTTLAASAITATNATLNGSVTPNGAASTVYFQWGATTSYGQFTLSNVLSGNLNSAQAVALDMTGLLAGTTNHFEAVAVNSAGTTYGADLTVVTPVLPPAVTTLAASAVTATNATLNGSVTPNGASSTVYFQWGATTNYGQFTSSNVLSGNLNTAQAVALDITGLLPGTTNHFEAVAVNSAGTTYGADLTVVTPALLPAVTTLAASAITATTATLNGSVTPNGASSTVYFQWGATTSYGQFTSSNVLSGSLNTAQAVASGITGLLPGTTNHFQAVAVNSAGTSYGADLTVVTPVLSPAVTTLAASAITPTNATLNGSVTPNGAASTVYFQWGATTSYGQFTSSNVLSGSLNTAQAVASGITGLLPGTTNHFQAVAVNSAGTNYGADLTVVTLALPPSVTTLAASAITGTAATLNASVTPNGGASTVYFQCGATTNYGQFTSSNVLSGNLNSAQMVALGITGLLPGTTSHFQAVAVNSAGTSYGADMTVVTPVLSPTVTTLAASAVTATNATLNASVTPNGTASAVYFQWGATTNYGQFTRPSELSGSLNSAQAVALDITGLLPGTTNHFEAVAVNSAGTSYGADMTVVTPALPPSVTTLAASAITATTATLNGSVTPNGASSTVYFQWGATTSYDQFTSSNVLSGNLNTAQAIASGITGLLPGTTNHFQAVAVNSAGTNYGTDLTVVTPVLPPSVTTLAASAITATNATLNGSVTPNGASSTVYFQWGATTSYGQFTSSNVLSGNLNSAQAIASGITGLLPGTTNHFQAVAVNSAGTTYGADLTVVTPVLPPAVTTLTASAITATNATLNGSVTPNGAASTVYFQWGATISYGQFTSSNVLSANLYSAQAVASGITGLLPGTTNHFQAVAVNSAGTTYGADMTVVTPPLAPSVTTLAASAITATNATLNGSVTPNGASSTVYFQWGATISYGQFTSSNVLSGNLNTAQAMASGITGLLPGTTNHFQAVAFNSAGTTYGADMSVVTPVLPPVVTTLAASAITATTATLNGSVTPNGASSTVYFQWGATTSYGQFTSSNVLSGSLNTAQAVASGITGLLPGTTNHFQAVAVNSAGTTYGVDMTVVTPALPPSVTTLAASAITATNATLNGSVTPNGASSTVYFQWGATTSYGQFTSSNVLSGNLNTAQAMASGITGLLPGTTNHFQAVAVNSVGTSYGADMTLVTPVLPPAVTTLAASAITATTATLNGSVTPNGASSTVYFQWGATTSYGQFTSSNVLSGNLYSAQAIASGITGLLPGTTNHFQAVAVNSAGTTYGADMTVVTPPLAPSVTTLAASAITATNATLNGSVTPNGASSTVYFQWGATTSYGQFTSSNVLSGSLNTAQAVASGITGLLPGTTNHFQAVAVNSAGTTYGADMTVVTPVLPPAVTTLAASAITATNATLNGSVTPNGATSTVYFQWGATISYGQFTSSNVLSENLYSAQAMASGITGLLPGTTNHFQAVAVNSAGTTYGADMTVVTPPLAPSVTTLAASAITATNATLNGSVTPNGASSTVYFQWGATTSYGQFTSSNVLSGNLNSAQAIASGITGLQPGTTSHFQAVAFNSAGTTYGADMTVVTPVTVFSPTNIPGMAYYWDFHDLPYNVVTTGWTDRVQNVVLTNYNPSPGGYNMSNSPLGVMLPNNGSSDDLMYNSNVVVGSNFTLWMVIRERLNSVHGTIPQYACLFGTFNGSRGLMLSNGIIACDWGNASNTIGGVMMSNWPVDLVYSQGTVYTNGVALSGTLPQPTNGFQFQTVGDIIPNGDGPTSSSFQGYIQYIGIWTNTLFTAANVSNLDNWVNTNGVSNITSGLTAWWQMKDGSGTNLLDSSGNSYSGTIQGGETWITNAPTGGGLAFNGSNTFVTTTNVPNTWTNMSFSFWMNTALPGGSLTGAASIPIAQSANNLASPGYGGPGWQAIIASTYARVHVIDAAQDYAITPQLNVVTDGRWHQCVFEIGSSPTNLLAFMDGELLNPPAGVSGIVGYIQTNIAVTMGSATDPVNGPYVPYYDGSLSDVRIYTNHVLTAQEVANLFLWRGQP